MPTFRVGASPRVEVDLRSGRLDLETGEPGEISLRLGGRYDEDDLDIDQIGDAVVVRHRPFGRGGSIRVYLTVPEGTDVTVAGASVDVWLSGRLGEVSIKTASGDVSMQRADRVEVRTASGDIKVDRVERDLSFNTASGDLYCGEVCGRLSGSLASGDLRANRVGGDLEVTTASGDVRVGCCEGEEASVKTVSGSLVVGVPAGTKADVDIQTLSGRVRLPEPTERRPPPAEEEHRLRLRARSVSGDVEIQRVERE